MAAIPAEDRLAIQELTHLYAFYSDTKQFSKVVDLFVDDCVFDESCFGLPVLKGKEAIRGYFVGGPTELAEYFVHFVTNHIILEYSEGYARGISYIQGEGRLKDGTESRVLGYKEDEYVKVSGRWLFRSRLLVPFTAPIGLDL